MRPQDPKVELLRRVGIPEESRGGLSELASLFDDVTVDAGEVLMREGRTASEAFLIVEGTASVTLHGVFLASIGPGELIGEMALLDHSPRSATVTATTPMRLLVIHAGSFASLLRRPTIAWRVASRLASRLRRLQGAPTYDCATGAR